MCQQWDYLMGKKSLINYQVMIKLKYNNKENYYLNDLNIYWLYLSYLKDYFTLKII